MIKRRISPRIIIESELINHPSCYFINIIKILKQKDLSLERFLTRGKNSLNGNTCVENYYNKSIKSVYIKICEVVVLRLTYGITIRLITLTISNIVVTFFFILTSKILILLRNKSRFLESKILRHIMPDDLSFARLSASEFAR